MEQLKELVQFMQPTQRLDLKAVALTHVLGLTGSAEGKAIIFDLSEMLEAILRLTTDKAATIAKDAVLSLINLTAEGEGAVKVYRTSKAIEGPFDLVAEAVKCIIDENSELADPWSMVVSNLTRVESLVPEVLGDLESEEQNLLKLVKVFTQINFNKKKCRLNYLGPIFCNLTQTSRGRELFCQSKYDLLDKVLPFASYEESVVRRGGTVGLLKNICFDSIYHELILADREDILCAILRPLCGPEEFSDEENDKFPLELQYLPETKVREEDADLRKMLLECLLQLCATKRYRELLRAKGVYEILREYHKWESNVSKDRDCLIACENVVDILIKEEHEIGLDNYHEVQVPSEVAEKFVQDDDEYLNHLKPE